MGAMDGIPLPMSASARLSRHLANIRRHHILMLPACRLITTIQHLVHSDRYPRTPRLHAKLQACRLKRMMQRPLPDERYPMAPHLHAAALKKTTLLRAMQLVGVSPHRLLQLEFDAGRKTVRRAYHHIEG